MPEKIFIQRLALYLKSGTNLVIDFGVLDPGIPCPQIESLKKPLISLNLKKRLKKSKRKLLNQATSSSNSKDNAKFMSASTKSPHLK